MQLPSWVMSRTLSKLVLVVASALALSCGAASAADLPPMRAYSWQGPYVGANLGHQWGRTTGNLTDPAGIAGGLQAGFNVPRGAFVVGVETDLQLSGADNRFAPWKFSNPWFGTLRARGGYAVGNFLFYGTAGLASGALRGQNTRTGLSQSKTNFGWAVGAGMEIALTSNWSARAEYLYVDLNDRSYLVSGTNNGLESSLLRFGINYRF